MSNESSPQTIHEENIRPSPSPATDEPSVAPITASLVQPTAAAIPSTRADFRQTFNFNVREILDDVGRAIFESILESYTNINGLEKTKCTVTRQSMGLEDRRLSKQKAQRTLEEVEFYLNEIEYTMEFFSSYTNNTHLPNEFQEYIDANKESLTTDLRDANLTQINGSSSPLLIIPPDPTLLPSQSPTIDGPTTLSPTSFPSSPTVLPTNLKTSIPSLSPSLSLDQPSASPLSGTSSTSPSTTNQPSPTPTTVPTVEPTFAEIQISEADFRQKFLSDEDKILDDVQTGIFERIFESYIESNVLRKDSTNGRINTTCTVADQSIAEQHDLDLFVHQIEYTVTYSSFHESVTSLPDDFQNFINGRRKNREKLTNMLNDWNLTQIQFSNKNVLILPADPTRNPSQAPSRGLSHQPTERPIPSELPSERPMANSKGPSLSPTNTSPPSFHPRISPAVTSGRDKNPATAIAIFATIVCLALAIMLYFLKRYMSRKEIKSREQGRSSNSDVEAGQPGATRELGERHSWQQTALPPPETSRPPSSSTFSVSSSASDQSLPSADASSSCDPAFDDESDATSSFRVDPTGDPSKWSISYDQLMEFHEVAMKKYGRRYSKVNMRDIVKDIIKPHCRKHGTSYALSVNPEGLPMEAFVTHSWDELFQNFIQSIKNVYDRKLSKPNLWICGFALNQSDDEVIEKQVDVVNPADSPFIVALSQAFSFIVVRNLKTDLYSRIWCVCELIYAKKLGLVPHKTYITGPDKFSHLQTSALDAKASTPEDRDKILKVLQTEHNIKEVDEIVSQFRQFSSSPIELRRWKSFGGSSPQRSNSTKTFIPFRQSE